MARGLRGLLLRVLWMRIASKTSSHKRMRKEVRSDERTVLA
jgi:hypothetical protein